MHISSINQQIYNNRIRRNSDKQSYYQGNNKTNNTISFAGYKNNLDTKCAVAGVLLGIALLIMSTTMKYCEKKSTQEFGEQTKEYYDATLIKHQYSIFSDEGSDSGRVITRNEREHAAEMNAKKDSLLKDFKYGTKERDNFEKIYRNSYDSITAPHSPSGKKIIYNEWYQTIVDLEDSIKAKYPDKEINVKL